MYVAAFSLLTVSVLQAPSSTPVEVVPLSGCHVKECLDTSLPFRATLALEEALLLLSSSSRMPSAQVMAVICEKVILAEVCMCVEYMHNTMCMCVCGV